MRVHTNEDELTRQGVEINIDGYATATGMPGYGGVVYLERYEGKVRLHVWSDINQEDPTHTIDLAGAKESNRRAEPTGG